MVAIDNHHQFVQQFVVHCHFVRADTLHKLCNQRMDGFGLEERQRGQWHKRLVLFVEQFLVFQQFVVFEQSGAFQQSLFVADAVLDSREQRLARLGAEWLGAEWHQRCSQWPGRHAEWHG
jgi:hypothetical protein